MGEPLLVSVAFRGQFVAWTGGNLPVSGRSGLREAAAVARRARLR